MEDIIVENEERKASMRQERKTGRSLHSTNKNPVPSFTLVSTKRGTTKDGVRVASEAISIKCKRDDQELITHLLVAVHEVGLLGETKFLQHGVGIVEESFNRMRAQNAFIDNTIMIPIIGLPERACSTALRLRNGDQKIIERHILDATNRKSLEKMYRTKALEKFHLVLAKEDVEGAKRWLDDEFPRFFGDYISWEIDRFI